MSVFQCPNDSLFVHHAPTRRVHEHAPALHRPDLAFPDQVPSVLTQRHVHAQHVRPLTQFLKTFDILAPLRYVGPAVPVMIEHAHRKGVDKVGEVQTDPSHPEDAEGTRREIVRVPQRDGGVPGPGVKGTFGLGKVAESGDNEVKRGGGGSFVDYVWGIGDTDAWGDR